MQENGFLKAIKGSTLELNVKWLNHAFQQEAALQISADKCDKTFNIV